MSTSDGGLDLALRLEAGTLNKTLARPAVTYLVLLDYGQSLEIQASTPSERFAKMREAGIDLARDRWAAYHVDPDSGRPAFCGNDEPLLAELFRQFREMFSG